MRSGCRRWRSIRPKRSHAAQRQAADQCLLLRIRDLIQKLLQFLGMDLLSRQLQITVQVKGADRLAGVVDFIIPEEEAAD